MRKRICEKLKALREKLGYSQQDVADAIHISQNTCSLIETGKTKMDVERLSDLVVFYKISLYDLLELSPSKNN